MSQILNFLLITTFVIQSVYGGGAHSDPHFVGDRRVITQLMDWKYSDIAKECEEFLGPHGYGGVQTSPVQANIIEIPKHPWSERYAPVSYKIINRSGNEDEFRNMVDRCNKANVRVFVDVVLNHMSGPQKGKGTDGSDYDGNTMRYDGVPFSSLDFHGHEACPTDDLEIHDYTDPIQARNCRLGTLRDLNQGKEYVRQKQSDFLNKLIDMGVAGFRADASKHQWPQDMTAIINKLHNLNTKYFPSGSKSFWCHEFIQDQSGTKMKSEEYLGIGRVIEFRYYRNLGEVLRKHNNQKLKYLKNFGEGWGFLGSGDSLVMIDSHDLQRGHNGDFSINIAYFEPRLLKMATAFMLAFPYSITRVMSSYFWPRDIHGNHDNNDWIGPPNINGSIKSVTHVNADNTCDKNWVCEHRWRQIYNMVKFRNAAADSLLSNWWDNGNNAIAFSRANKAFIVINNDDSPIDHTFQTGLAAGHYCDVISGILWEGKCSGKTITVGSDGSAHITVDNKSDDPMVAIHVQAKL